MKLFLALFAVLGAASVQCSTPSDTHYMAAVVDFHAPSDTLALASAGRTLTPEESMMENVAAVGRFMAEAAQKGVDIIVFPEEGLKGFLHDAFPMAVPKPEDNAIPCKDESMAQPLRNLSCLAEGHKMYLVVNLVHEVRCTPSEEGCPQPRGAWHYNTDVVFDRSGKIVARYHKYNLFGERGRDVPPAVEYSIFDTDFGVTFGMFICFDILFDKPAAELVRKHHVTDFVFSAAWFSEVPFLTAVQAHSGWAHALDVTVLSACYNNPRGGGTGSGVYLGRHGILDATMNWSTVSSMLVHRVPKHSHWDQVDIQFDLDRFDPVQNYGTGKDPYDELKQLRMIQDNMTMYQTEPLARLQPGEEKTTVATVCDNDLCCKFHVRAHGVSLFQTGSAAASVHGYSRLRDAPTFDRAHAEKDFDGFHYKMVAFSGVRDHSGVATTGVQVCGLISCLDDSIKSCGWITPGLSSPSIKWTEFLDVTIQAEYKTEGTLQLPSILAGPRYEPLPASLYTFQSEPGSDTTTVSLSLKKPVLDLRTVAIYGRYFAWDGQKATGY